MRRTTSKSGSSGSGKSLFRRKRKSAKAGLQADDARGAEAASDGTSEVASESHVASMVGELDVEDAQETAIEPAFTMQAQTQLPEGYTFLRLTVELNGGRLGVGLDDEYCVTQLVPGGPGELVGLRVDDQLVEVNGVSVFSSNEPISTLLPKHGDQLILGIRRPPTTHEAAPPEPTSSQGQEVSLTASVTNGSRVDVHMELPRANAQPCSAVPTEHLPQQDGELKTASAPIPEPEGLEEMQQDQLGMRGGHERS